MPRIVPHLLPTADHVQIVAELIEEAGNLGRIILQISIHRDDDVAGGHGEPGCQPLRFPEVAAMAQSNDRGITFRQRFHHLPGLIRRPIVDEDVLLVEDIIDTGLTLNYLKHLLEQRQPRSLKTVAFLDKPSRRRIDVQGDYVGFTIEDRFVIGYGLDFEQRYRNLRDLCVLVP